MKEKTNSGKEKPQTREVNSYPKSMEAEMTKYGIVQKQTQSFLYGKYKYGSLVDALAQARRDEKAGRL